MRATLTVVYANGETREVIVENVAMALSNLVLSRDIQDSARVKTVRCVIPRLGVVTTEFEPARRIPHQTANTMTVKIARR